MAKFNNGYDNITVKLIGWSGDNFAKEVYEFGRLSHDYNEVLPEVYDKNNPDCIKLINKIIEGTTLPKFAMQGTRIRFQINKISRICLAQLTRDPAIFASASTGVFPLTQEFNMPMSIIEQKDVMDKVCQAQKLLEEAYIMLCEREIPSIEARYVGLHPQVISLTAAYLPYDFSRASYSRTSSNFCDECNYLYRLMYHEIFKAIDELEDANSIRLWKWLINEGNCINDGFYKRERLFNSDFTCGKYSPKLPALNDWRKSGWKKELERMYNEKPYLLTYNEYLMIEEWLSLELHGYELPTTYDGTKSDVLKNAIKEMDYYEK